MAEDDAKRSKASSFLKKSKWGKLLKEREPDSAGDGAPGGGGGGPTRHNTFTLNDDVVDFLKPSTEKSKPKLDIAIAKRWPDAHEVKIAGEASPQLSQPTYTKPKRRKGLTVSFVRTVPDVIGEGGDEALDPPREIGRNKALVQRSRSDRKPGSQDFGRHGPISPPLEAVRAPPPQVKEEEGEFVPKPLQRAQTSHNELSLPLQRKVASPPSAEAESHKPSLGRMPTGMSSYRSDHFKHTSPIDTPIDKVPVVSVTEQNENERPWSRERPKVNTNWDHLSQNQELRSSMEGVQSRSNFPVKGYPGLSPNSAMSPVARKGREMSASEGMAFRRASLLPPKDEEDEDNSPPGSSQQQQQREPPSLSTSQLSPAGSVSLETISSPAQDTTPQTASSTKSAPNPFEDPKYLKRRSREMTLARPFEEAAQPQSLRQTARPQAYTRSPQASKPYSEPPRVDAEIGDSSRPSAFASVIQASADRRPPRVSPQPSGHQRTPSREEGAVSRSDGGGTYPRVPPPQAPSGAQRMAVLSDSSYDKSLSPALHERPIDTNPSATLQRPVDMLSRPNGSLASLNSVPPSVSLSRSASRGVHSPQMLHTAGALLQQSQTLSPQSVRQPDALYKQQSNETGSNTSLLNPNRNGSTPSGPSSRRHGSPNDFHGGFNEIQAQARPSKSPLQQPKQDEERPRSSGSSAWPSVSPQPPEHGNPAADVAFIDFAGRVAHMKGVFRLTAEKEQSRDKCTPELWLRAGLWWYLQGKTGLEVLLQRRNHNEPPRELLGQPHVDLAKAWWILSDPLEPYDSCGDLSPRSARSPDGMDSMLERGVSALREHLKAISLSMGKNKLFPPTQSLIQGQDTSIWLEYPRFTSDATAALSGGASNSVIVQESKAFVDPYDVLPLGDSRSAFCYGRFPVEVSINTEEADTDRVALPCMLSVLRGRHDYQTSIAIASQNDIVNIKILPKSEDKRSLTWSNVSWKASLSGLVVRLPRNFDLTVRMQEKDFRAVWNLSEYARKVEKSLRPEPDEKLIHEARLAELQYADSSSSNAFPSEKVRGCRALVYERTSPHSDGSGTRKMHRGYRLLLITDPGHKTLSSVSHDICRASPLYFEYLTDSTANGTTAMVLRIREQTRQCRILLVFPDVATRQELYNTLNGLTVGPDETIVGKMALTALNFEPLSQIQALAQSAHPALQTLKWQKLGVTNFFPEDPNSRMAETVESEALRIIARHGIGCITDRLNLGKGELLLRIPPVDAPTVQILRGPQEDLLMSIDTRNSSQQVADGMGQILLTAAKQPTLRTFTFASLNDLHAFETAITGFTVRFDGVASTFGISRRRMVVPIYKKWEASNVRLQVVCKDTVVQLIAFMDDFSHADALCFQIKSTDTFESIKGDGKSKKWAVKMVDAKFTLPGHEKGEQSEHERHRRRFVNLEGLEYAEEHDDITIGFETEQDRDRFAQTLPAATSVSRGITLKRRI